VYNCGTISVKISLTELLWYNYAVLAFSTTTPGRRWGSSEPNEPPPGSAAVMTCMTLHACCAQVWPTATMRTQVVKKRLRLTYGICVCYFL